MIPYMSPNGRNEGSWTSCMATLSPFEISGSIDAPEALHQRVARSYPGIRTRKSGLTTVEFVSSENPHSKNSS